MLMQVKEETETPSGELITMSLENKIKQMLQDIDNSVKSLKQTKIDLKNILTLYQKETKEYSKKKLRVKTSYTPHGFTKAVKVSEELCKFLNQTTDTLIARPSVTKAIANYVKEHKLSDEADGSIFKADKVLKELLGEPLYKVKNKKPELGNGYSYQNLQKYLSKHFIKNV